MIDYSIFREIWGEVFPKKEKERSAKWGVAIGFMGAGKTTLAGLLYETFRDLYGETLFVRVDSVKDFIVYLNLCPGVKKENVFFLLDDASFSLFGITKVSREFLHEFFKVRHYCVNQSKIFSLFNVHYSKSIARFVRGAHLKILLSIDPVEWSNLKEIFPESDLVDYYDYYVENYQHRYIALIRTPLRSRIVDVTLSKENIPLIEKKETPAPPAPPIVEKEKEVVGSIWRYM